MIANKFNIKFRSIIAAASLMAMSGAASAVSVDKSFEYSCLYPVLGHAPVIINVHTELPDLITLDDTAEPYTVEIELHLLDPTWIAFRQIVIASLEGEITTGITITGNSNYYLDMSLTSAFPLMPIPEIEPDDFAIHATTEIDPITGFDDANLGPLEIVMQDKMYMRLRAFYPAKWGGPSIEFPGFPGWIPEDDNAFIVECDLVSADNSLATLGVVAPSMAFAVDGATNLGLAKVPVAISGNAQFDFLAAGGNFNAQLTFDQSYGVFPFFGLLKTLAVIDFEQGGVTTGTLNNQGDIALHSEMFIKLPDVYITLFGFNIRIAGGDYCGTQEIVTIDLYGSDFDVFGTGGLVSGNYAIPKIQQCGVFNGIVNAMLAGEGNSIEMDLGPYF